MSKVNFYLENISKYKLLTSDEEIEINKKMIEIRIKKNIKDNCFIDKEYLKLKNRMVIANLRLVVSIARKYKKMGFELIELINEGNLGLLRAVEKFDYKWGCRFSTYATFLIKQSILKLISERDRIVRLPNHIQQKIKKYNDTENYLISKNNKYPTNDEISNALSIPIKKTNELLLYRQNMTKLVGVDEDDKYIIEFISDEKTLDPIDNLFKIKLQEHIGNALLSLTEKEKIVIESRFGLNNKDIRTLNSIAKDFNVSKERIRQIEEKAMYKLSRCKNIKDYKYLQ